MLPCVCWLQPLLVLLSSVLRAQGENCPASCLCPDPHTVDCSGRGLTRLPDEIPLDVRRLLLSDNCIPRIPSDFLVLYSDLVYLDLRNNSLSHIEPGTLSTSSRLVFLDLGSNNLTEIPSGTFGQSRSLIKLRLGNNPYLSRVNEDAFLGLTSLRELELERNALSGLQVGALSQLPSLRVVRLEGNPWVCNCNFANLFGWLEENSQKLPNVPGRVMKDNERRALGGNLQGDGVRYISLQTVCSFIHISKTNTTTESQHLTFTILLEHEIYVTVVVCVVYCPSQTPASSLRPVVYQCFTKSIN
uniref:Leucine rich repeat containing 38 n=1 Tax=Oncorhynchus kisutch TaxID=8019 RepID=A0A8C7IBA6_ONCKI